MKKLLKAGLITLMMVGSLASCTDGVSGTTVATQPKDDGKITIEEAKAYQRLIKDYRLKQDEVAEKVSKSRAAITNSLRLLKLDERVQDMVIEGKISSGHARTIITIEDKDKQYMIAQKIFDEKLSVRDVEKLMKALEAPEKPEKKAPKNDFVYRDLEQKMKAIMGTQVVIKNKNNNKGKIEIEYYSQAELERIYELLQKIN